MTGWAVVLRGIRYRPGRSLIVVLLAAVSVGACVLAPAYSRAAQQSVLRDRLAAAPANATSLHLVAEPLAGDTATVTDSAAAKVELTQRLAARPTLRALLDRPVGAADVDTVAKLGRGDALALLAYRDNACAHLTIAEGDCPDSSGEVLISSRSATEHGVSVGSTLSLHGRTGAGASRTLTVAGTYEPRDPGEAYWGRGGYFGAGTADPDAALSRVDALFVGAEEDLTLPGAPLTVRLDYPLETTAVSLDDVARLRADLAGFITDVNAAQLQLSTSLPALLDEVDVEASALGRIVPVVAVPLVLICWFILFLLVAAVTEERAPEVALAQLRGYPPSRAARFGRAETLTLLAIAIPLGLALGIGLVELAARAVLATGVHVEPRWPLLVAAGLAAVGAYLAVRLGSAGILARPVLALLRRVPQRGRARAGIVEGIVVALAGASLAVAVSDQTAPLALLAPALLALVAGIIAARLLGLWSRVRLRRHARRGRVTGVLAHAQISRRTLGQRVVLVVTVSVALLSFAATAWDVADQARRDVATDAVGADRVLRVAAADPVALVAATTQAAPDGSVMPVVRVTERYGDGLVELIGVRSPNLADVAVWRGHDRTELARLAARLQPQTVAPLTISGRIEVDASATGLEGAPVLAAVVGSPGSAARTLRLGELIDGRQVYRAELDRCGPGCRLLGLAVVRASGAGPLAVSLQIHGLASTAGPVAAGFDAGDRWRVNASRAPSARVRVEHGAALGLTVSSADPGDVVVDYHDTPDALPVALAGASPDDDVTADEFTFPALGETPQRFAVIERTHSLPRVGGRALLFDLDYAVSSAQRSSALSDNSRLRYEVWASRSAPADLPARLAAAGVSVLADESIDSEQARLERGAPALGLRLSLLAAAAAMLLAVGAVLLTAYVGARARRSEFAALRVAGVRPATLRRGLLREYAHLLGVPLVVGALAGALAAAVILPGLPLVRVGAAIGAIAYTPDVGALTVAAGVTTIGLLLSLLAVLGLVRRATPERLREGSL